MICSKTFNGRVVRNKTVKKQKANPTFPETHKDYTVAVYTSYAVCLPGLTKTNVGRSV